MIWTPHATVAVVVEKDGKYLMVEEICHGETVYNQPAGHVDEGESILDAATRETMEETGWQVKLDTFIGLYTYKAPSNGVTYYRMCFAATAIQKITDKLDTDIICEHWLNYDEIVNLKSKLRSPLVKQCIDDHINKEHYPLTLIVET